MLRKRLLLSLSVFALVGVLGLVAELVTRAVRSEECRKSDDLSTSAEMTLRFLEPCFGSDPYWFTSQTPAEGRFRVIIVGESTGFALGHTLDLLLRDHPRLEVLNCAQPGASLEQMERRFDEATRYAPQAIVIVFGHNITFKPPTDERQLRLASWMSKSCLLSLSTRPFAEPVPQPELPDQLRKYEAFLRRAAQAGGTESRTIIATTMVGNHHFPPPLVAPRGLMPDQIAAFERALAEVRFREAFGQRDQARLALSREPLSLRPSVRDYYLGKWLLAEGEDEAGATHLQRSFDEEPQRQQAPRVLNDVLRRVAGETPLQLRDTDLEQRRVAPQGLPGWETLVDHVHPVDSVLRAEAEALLKSLPPPATTGLTFDWSSVPAFYPPVSYLLDRVLKFAPSLDSEWGSAWYDALEDHLAYWLRQTPETTREEIASFLSGDVLRNSPDGRGKDRFLMAVSHGLLLGGEAEEARRIYALTERTSSGEVWAERGRFLLRVHELERARQAFTRAVDLEPDNTRFRTLLELASETAATK